MKTLREDRIFFRPNQDAKGSRVATYTEAFATRDAKRKQELTIDQILMEIEIAQHQKNKGKELS